MADVLLLYGVTARDEKEMVAQFFDNRKDLEDFRENLPGRYQIMGIDGVDYDALAIVSVEVEVDLDEDDPYWTSKEVSGS